MGLSSVSELRSGQEKSLKNFIKNNFPIYLDGSSGANSADSVFLTIKQKKRSVFLKVALIFSLPLLFLGKTGAYFFGVWLSNTFNIHIFLLSVIFWLLSLVFLAAINLNAIALLKLKYPTQEEIEAYKSKGKV